MKKFLYAKSQDLKEYSISIVVISLFILLILFSKQSLLAAQNGLDLFLNSVLPSIFPFLVVVNIIINLDILKKICKLFNPLTKKVFNLPGISTLPIIIGLISGYPIGAKISNDLYSKNLISKNTAEKLLGFTNNSGPLFILSYVGISLYHDLMTGILLLCTHILSAITVGIIFGLFDKKNTDRTYIDMRYEQYINGSCESLDKKIPKNISFSQIVIDSVKNSVNTILIIGGFIIFFSVIIQLLESSNLFYALSVPINSMLITLGLPTELTIPTLQGLVEITNGLERLSNVTTVPYVYKVCISAFILGIGGLSIYMQTLTIIIDNNLSTKKYIIGKILQGILAFIFTYILVIYTPFFNLGAIETYVKPSVDISTVMTTQEINIFLDVIIICFISCVLFKMYQIQKVKNKN